jgi:hypothetical protein
MMRPRLRGFELAWTNAAFDTFFPENTALPHGVLRMDPARFLDTLLGELPLEQALGVRATLWIIALAPLFTIRRVATIASLACADRALVIDRLLASRIYAVRQLVAGFKAIATLLYAQSPAVRRAMTVPVGPPSRDLVPVERLQSSGTYKKPGIALASQGGRHEHVA